MMTIIEIIQEVKKRNDDDVSFASIGKPESAEGLTLFEKSRKIILPDDYKTVMKKYGKFDFSGPDTNIITFSLEEINKNILNNTEQLGNVFVFGSDNGGNYYFYDIDNISGRGAYSIHDVYPGNPEWKHCTYLSLNLTALLEKIAKGERFE